MTRPHSSPPRSRLHEMKKTRAEGGNPTEPRSRRNPSSHPSSHRSSPSCEATLPPCCPSAPCTSEISSPNTRFILGASPQSRPYNLLQYRWNLTGSHTHFSFRSFLITHPASSVTCHRRLCASDRSLSIRPPCHSQRDIAPYSPPLRRVSLTFLISNPLYDHRFTHPSEIDPVLAIRVLSSSISSKNSSTSSRLVE